MSIVLPQCKTRSRLLLAIPFIVGCTLAQAAPLDGQWKGFLQCSALLTDPAKSPAFNVPIAMTVSGKTVTVIRDTEKVREEMNGNLGAGDSLALSGPGKFKNGSGPIWTTRISGKFTGNQFAGKGGIYSAEGTKWRDCSAEFIQAVATTPAEKAAQASSPAQPDKPVQVATNQPPNAAPATASNAPVPTVAAPAATQPAPVAKPETLPQTAQAASQAQATNATPQTVSPSPSTGLQLKCPLDWSALADIDSNDPNRLILGLKASDWKKEHVDQMLRQEEECQRLSRAPDSVKSAVMVDVHRTSYPNGLKAIERRDKRIQEEAERSKRAEDDRQRREVESQRIAVESQRLQLERDNAERMKAETMQRQRDAQASYNRQSSGEGFFSSLIDKMMTVLFWLAVIGVIGAAVFIWHKFFRLRCPECKATSPEIISKTETDRWRGTKQVSEKNTRGTNTRHVQTTYVKNLYEYRCKTCGHVWQEEKTEEMGA